MLVRLRVSFALKAIFFNDVPVTFKNVTKQAKKQTSKAPERVYHKNHNTETMKN